MQDKEKSQDLLSNKGLGPNKEDLGVIIHKDLVKETSVKYI